MQKQLDIATKWSHDNGLIINSSKTKVMHIKPPHLLSTNIQLKYHNTQCLHNTANNPTILNDTCTTVIENVDTYKYLGIIVDNKFKWKPHLESLQKKLRKSSFILCHLSYMATYDVLRQAYYSLVESYSRHGITAWGNVKYSSTLQKTQNQILKILWKKLHHNSNQYPRNTNNINNVSMSDQQYNTTNPFNHINTQFNNNTIRNKKYNIHELAKDLKILNIKNIYFSTTAKEFFNDTRFIQPIDHSYNTRRRAEGRYKIDRFTNEYGRSTLEVVLPTILNKLPTNILQITDKYKRNKLIKEHFINLQ